MNLFGDDAKAILEIEKSAMVGNMASAIEIVNHARILRRALERLHSAAKDDGDISWVVSNGTFREIEDHLRDWLG